VPLLLPRPTPYRDARDERLKFDSKLYLRYREYRAALGVAAAFALLVLKWLVLR
jgi:hypothetical protein